MNARGEAEQGLEGRHRGAPPVEAEGELVQVGLEVVVTDAMVGADQPTLEVPEHAMNARQDLPGSLGWALALGAGSMTVAHARQRGVGTPAIGQDDGARRHAALDESGQRARRGVRYDPKANP